jgi:starch synthase
MHVLLLCPEVLPFSQTDERAELVAGLARALSEAGARATVLTPFYRGIESERFGLVRRIRRVAVPLGGGSTEIGIVDGKLPGCDVPVIFVDHPESFDREGIYGDAGRGEARRCYLLARAAIAIAKELGLAFDVLHAHDWRAAFLPLACEHGLAPELGAARRVFTLREVAGQGLFDPAILDELALGYDRFHPDGIEFHGRVSLVKAGVLYSDAMVTWSPSYARELAQPEHGGDLDGLFRAVERKLVGIPPGLDPSWSPASDHRVAERYQADNLHGKEACRRALGAAAGLPPRPQAPLLLVDGCAGEGGALFALAAAPLLTQHRLQAIVLGARDPALEALADGGLACLEARSGDALRRALAGADALLLLARSAPSGLLPLKALRYGAVPVARGVGAFSDALVDFDARSATGTAICFGSWSADALAGALARLVATHAAPARWQALVANGMRQSQPWSLAAARHLELYRRIAG